MTHPIQRILVLAALLVFCCEQAGQAQSPSVPAKPATPEAIRQTDPSFFVRVSLDRASGIYREREALSIKIACEENAYIYVLYKQADGQVFQVFPNSIQQDNRLLARQALQIPSVRDRFEWVVGPPFGKEVIKVLASKQPIAGLDDPKMRARVFNPVKEQQVKALLIEMRDEISANWAEDQVELTTYPTSQRVDLDVGRRWGAFFGVSNYLFNAEKEAASEGKDTLTVPTPHRDAREMERFFRTTGQLADSQVYTNEEATRANIKKAITEWLPSVSRPGDTVFLFFAGHGMQIPDDGRDESDRQDEVILPFEYLDAAMLQAALEKVKADQQLDTAAGPYLQEAVKRLKSLKPNEDANLAIARHFSISDDQFGHWLQRLSGRQVVVILNTCHSGGFAAQEKGLRAPRRVIPFDFLDGELGRLKDLGQPELALMSACSASEVARIHYKRDLSVFPYYLLECLENSDRSVTLDDAYGHCRSGMASYFQAINQALREAGKSPITGHEPLVFNHCTTPILLKP